MAGYYNKGTHNSDIEDKELPRKSLDKFIKKHMSPGRQKMLGKALSERKAPNDGFKNPRDEKGRFVSNDEKAGMK